MTTEASIPVLNAARDAKLLDRLTIITTDLFPDLVPQIRSGAVAATIYQRPRAQGQIAFRMLHEFLVEGASRSHQVALAPHLVMRGNLDFFLQRQSQESAKEEKAKINSRNATARTGGGFRLTAERASGHSKRKPRGGTIAYLGIDVGTGGTRALVMDAAGKVIASGSEEHEPFASPRPGWAEQDPRDWWRACGVAVRKALQSPSCAPDDIACVGFSGQMHGAVLLDSADEVVRSAHHLVRSAQRSAKPRTGENCLAATA